jgi:Tfp pilus assembly protein PilO
MTHSGNRANWIVALTVVAGIAACVTLVLLPAQRACGKLAADVTAEQAYVDRMGDLAPALRATQTELEAARRYSTAWIERAPNEKELAKLFGQITALAKAAGATTTRFDPDPIVVFDKVRKIPLTVGCRGSYSQVHRFLRDLEGLSSEIWVERVGLEKILQSSKEIRCEVSLVIFADNSGNSDQVNLSVNR